jgi:dTDP-4-dehydrorhamnose 3,5-epimerase
MEFMPARIPDVVVIKPEVFGDDRGFFMETWEARRFAKAGIDVEFVQDNHSKSSQGVLRGLHYQIRRPQGKLVRVVAGEVFDVAVDLRRSFGTFGMWVGSFLSADNRRMLWIPPGFAHGFYVTSRSSEFVYKCSAFYAPEDERSIIWNDPDLAIDWPLINGKPPTVSQKDSQGISLKDAETYP